MALALGVFLIGAGIFFFYYESTREEEQLKRDTLKHVLHSIHDSLGRFNYGLEALGGLYAAKDFHPSFETLKEFAELNDDFKKYPSSKGFGFIRRVEAKDLEAYLKKRKSQGFKGEIKTYSSKRFSDDHRIIERLDPFEMNKSSEGFDLSTDEDRNRATLDSEFGKAKITPPIQLIIYKTQGFLLVLPLFEKKTADHGKPVGWVFTVISGQLLQKYMTKAIDPDWAVKISDAVNGAFILDTRTKGESKFRFVQTEKVKVYGRTWELKIYNRQSFSYLRIYFCILGFVLISLVYITIVQKFYEIAERNDDVENEKTNLELWRKTVLESADFTIVATNLKGEVTIFNKAAEKILGYEAKEVLGKPAPKSFHLENEVEEYSQELEKIYNTKIERGTETFVYRALREGSDTREWTVEDRYGNLIPVRMTITPLRDVKDEIIGFMAVSQDLRDIRSMQSAMISSAKMSALGEMTAGIAHEINNPLGIINLSSAVIKKICKKGEMVSSAEILAELKIIQETCVRISHVVKGFRNFSRDASLDPQSRCTFKSILDEALDLSAERIRNQHFEIKFAGDENLEINCRSVQISQVLLNLFNNSFDALKESDEKWIKIECWQDEKFAYVNISDAGKGIPPEIRAKLMTPFFTTKAKGQGTGIGLSISRKIMQEHGGELNILASAPNTTFQLVFPRV